MTTKLVSANMGIILVVERDGKIETKQMSVTCPSVTIRQPKEVVEILCEFLMAELHMELWFAGGDTVSIAKPKRLKPSRIISQKEFNKKIKALGYQP